MSKPEIDYAKTLAELESILARLQNSETSLDDAITLHTKGKTLVVALEDYLHGAEITVQQQAVNEQ